MHATRPRPTRWLALATCALALAACGDDAKPAADAADAALPADTAAPDAATPDAAEPDTATADTARI